MKENEIELGLQTDITYIAKDEITTRVVEVEINAPVAKDEVKRQPINLAVVLDRSGSMHGNKLFFAKQAALHVVEMLDDIDRLALIIYDDEVNILSNSVPMTSANRLKIKSLLHQVECGGSTNLSGGWFGGCQQVAAAAKDNTVNRVLLLSDGQANAGITDSEELSQHARELANRGVSTSTFGVGKDFNEHLMETMANHGQGNFYFIETPQDIPNIFSSEFKELTAITAKDVEVKMDLPKGATYKLFGGYAAKMNKQQLVISIGSLYSGKAQMVYLKVDFPFQSKNESQEIKASLYARGEDGELLESSSVLTYTYSEKVALDKAPKNIPLLQRFSAMELAEVANEALKLERQGLREEASQMLNLTIAASAPYTDNSVRDAYTTRAMQMKRTMTEGERKTSHYENYRTRHMHIRGINRFPLEIISGHLVIRVERFRDVLDTGSPVSIGRIRKFLFMGDMFPLQEEVMGVDIDIISRQVGEQVDAMLGMDVLRNFNIYINYSERSVVISTGAFDNSQGIEIPIEEIMGIPIITVPVNGTDLKMYLDTGSPLNYLAAEYTQGLHSVDTAKDTYPGAGEFTTPIFELPMDITGVSHPFRFGVLPPALEKTLLASGVKGILGTELYRYYEVRMSFRNMTVVIAPFNS